MIENYVLYFFNLNMKGHIMSDLHDREKELRDSKIEIKRNRIKCLKCEDMIESTYRWDFVWCKCKSVAVDGGLDYLRRVGKETDYEDMSE